MARAFDRWTDVVAEAGKRSNKAAAVEASCFAARALSVLAAPFARGSFDPKSCIKLCRDGGPLAAFEAGHGDREGADPRHLLVRKTGLFMG